MNRTLTNAIRFVMDECLPPVIRDSRWFMYPFFYIWFKGKHIREIMEFKSQVYRMTPEEFSAFYEKRDSLATDRPTDLSAPSIEYMLSKLDPQARTLLDVGCGKGYWLGKVNQKGLATTGCDVVEHMEIPGSSFVSGNIEKLPFPDRSFDIVTCHHTLEHVINLQTSISELKRVARKQVIVVVPCQRYFYYTLDEHIRFFPYKELLEHEMGMKQFECRKLWGDLIFIGTISD